MGKGATVKKLDTGTGRSPTFPCHHRRPFFRCKYTNNRQKPNQHKAFCLILKKHFAFPPPRYRHICPTGPDKWVRARRALKGIVRRFRAKLRKDSGKIPDFFCRHVQDIVRKSISLHSSSSRRGAACPHPTPPHLRTNSFSHSPLPTPHK